MFLALTPAGMRTVWLLGTMSNEPAFLARATAFTRIFRNGGAVLMFGLDAAEVRPSDP